MNSDSDLQIAGDILEVPHLLQSPREHPATVAEFAVLSQLSLANVVALEELLHAGS
ncbi:cysteine dioxygenase, partial [Streptomyces sp. NPDC048188]